jgi:hypothetical protein
MYRLCSLGGCLLLAVGSLAGWARAHRGYAGVVYYQRSRVVTGRPSGANRGGLMQTWIDPRRLRFREDWQGWSVGAPAGRVYIVGATMAVQIPGHTTWISTLPPGEQQRFTDLEHLLDRGGFGALGAFFLHAAFGPVAHTRLGGRPALRFTTFAHPIHTPTGEWTMWLDPTSLVPLQYQLSLNRQVIDTQPFEQAARLAPNSLPAGFFDLPRTGPSLWDRLAGWAVHLLRRVR